MTTTTPHVGAGYRPAADAAVRAIAEVARVHLPDTADYARLTGTSNLTRAVRPVAVVEVRDAAQVAATLRIAAASGVQVAVQGTGHGATDPMADAILVHTGALDELTLHADEHWARVGAGVRWDRVIEAAAPHGLAPLCGSSPDVGVVGYLTGGGVGPLVRSHGLSSDHVRAFEVVTGDGVVRRASATEHADLFWGLRGGKGSLGIVTAVEIDLPPLAEVYGGSIFFDGADIPAVVRTWTQWADLLPTDGTTSIAVLRMPQLDLVPEPLRGRTVVNLRFAWVGDVREGEEMIRAMRAVAAPVVDTVRVMPYAQIGSVHDDPVDPMPLVESTMLLREFEADTAERLLELVGPGAPTVQLAVEVRQLGGALRHGDDCAFAHRDAGWSVFLVALAIPETADLAGPDARRIVTGLQPWAAPGGLPNFLGEPGRGFAVQAYPDAAVARRLRGLVATYDPAGVLLSGSGLRG